MNETVPKWFCQVHVVNAAVAAAIAQATIKFSRPEGWKKCDLCKGRGIFQLEEVRK